MSMNTFLATMSHGLARASQGASGEWSVEFLLNDHDVRCLAADPLNPRVIYAGTQGKGVLRSDDGGKTWRSVGLAGQIVKALAAILFEDDASIFTALRAGARGYILKDAQEEEMLRAIRAVGSGEAIFSPAIATRLMDFFAAPRPAAPKEIFPTLTEREREILQLIAHGRANNDIAKELALSSKTVGNYVSNIFSKLQVADRAQAIIRARDAGLM